MLRPDSSVVHTCLYQDRWRHGDTIRIECRPGVTGRIVRVVSDHRTNFQLFEVKVYGIYGKINKKHILWMVLDGICLYVYVCMYVCMYMYKYIHVSMYVCMCVCMFVCMCVCMYVGMQA